MASPSNSFIQFYSNLLLINFLQIILSNCTINQKKNIYKKKSNFFKYISYLLFFYLVLFSFNLSKSFVKAVPLGYNFATTNHIFARNYFIYLGSQPIVSSMPNITDSFGTYYLNGFASSQNPKLKPLHSITKMDAYYVLSIFTQISFKFKIIFENVDYINNNTDFSILVSFLDPSNVINARVDILFFDDDLLDVIYSGYAQSNTLVTFDRTIIPSSNLQIINKILILDLDLVFQDANFNFTQENPQIIAFIAGYNLRKLDSCQNAGVLVSPTLQSFGERYNELRLDLKYPSRMCNLIPELVSYTVSFILFSKTWLLSNSQLYIQYQQQTAFTNFSSSGGTFTLTKQFSGKTIPLDHHLYGALAFIPGGGDSSIKFDINQVLFNSSQFNAIFTNPWSRTSLLLDSFQILFIFHIQCPSGTYFVTSTNTCSSCLVRNFIDYDAPKYYTYQCKPCHYSCATCDNTRNCKTCSSTNDHRFMNNQTLLCQPLLGYYDDGTNNPIAIACNIECKTCSGLPSICTSCYNNSIFINDTCIFIGCLSLLNTNGNQVCLVCNIWKNFIHYKDLCICDKGFTMVSQINLPSKCISICSDGLVKYPDQQCDDGNKDENDGCNQNCKIQNNFKCSLSQPSKCVLYYNFYQFVFNYGYKKPYQNRAILSFSIHPYHKALIKTKWDKLLALNISHYINTQSISYKYIQQLSELLVQFQYTKDLQNIQLQTHLIFDKSLIVSTPDQFLFTNKLNGINAPLVLNSEIQTKVEEISSIITFIIIIIILIQFYIGSYIHKMIGLQTIHIPQLFFFSKMVIQQQSTTLLSALNPIKYSVNGYTNPQLFFGVPTGDGTIIGTQKFINVDPQFLKVDLEKYFILNTNIFILPLLISLTVYSIYLSVKYYKRKKYLQTKDQHTKDQYTIIRRSCDWIYNHFVFPYVSMFNMISFFNSILYLDALDEEKRFELSTVYYLLINSSFGLHVVFLFITIIIYCHQIFQSYHMYWYQNLTSEQKQKMSSIIEKLEYDENSLEKANYHSLYVLLYLIFILLMQIAMIFSVMIKQLDIGLQMVLIISVLYLFFISFWKPYDQIVNQHNRFLSFNYLILVVFIVICYLFDRTNSLSPKVYISLISIMMFLLIMVMFGGYYRIFVEKSYRKWLQQNSRGLKSGAQSKIENNGSKTTRKQALLRNNQFLFSTQLQQLARKYGYGFIGSSQENKKISKQDEQSLMKIMRQKFKQQNRKAVKGENMTRFYKDLFQNQEQLWRQQKQGRLNEENKNEVRCNEELNERQIVYRQENNMRRLRLI